MALPVKYMERLLEGRGLSLPQGRTTKLVRMKKPIDACVIDITKIKSKKCISGRTHTFHVLHDRAHYCLLVTHQEKCCLFNPLGFCDISSVPFVNWCKGHVSLERWSHARLQLPTAVTCGYWTLAFAQALAANIERNVQKKFGAKLLDTTYRQIARYNDIRIKSRFFVYCKIKTSII